MKIFIDVNSETKRVEGWGSSKLSLASIEIEIAEADDFFKNPFVFVYVDGNLIKDEEYQQELLEEEKKRKNTPSQIEQLLIQNAALAFELMTTTSALKDSQQQQADVLYTLMEKGVV
jgi:hypothetical protein